MPLINIILLIKATRNIKFLDEKTYKELFGAFYEDLEKKKLNGLVYQLIYFARRIIFIVISFNLQQEKF
jgi:hypothetical protein